MRTRILLFAIMVTWLAAAGCAQQEDEGQGGAAVGMGGPPPVRVVLAPVVMQDYAPAIELVGEVRASQRAVLASEVAGVVVGISHRVGEAHPRSAGALIRIAPADYALAVDSARAQLAQTEEALSVAKQGPRSQEIAAQEANVVAAEANHRQAVDNLARQQKLYDAGASAEQILVTARIAVDAAAAQLTAQEQLLDQMLEGNRAEDISQVAAAVDMARAQLAKAELQLSKTRITPAFDAVVTGLFVEVGQSIGIGTNLVEVVNDGLPEVWLNIPQEEVTKVAVGSSVEVRADARPDQVYHGIVVGISPAADQVSRQFPARVSMDSEELLPGMAVRGRILTAETQLRMMIPRDAVVLTATGETVYFMLPPDEPTEPLVEGAMPPLPSVMSAAVVTGASVEGLVVIEEGSLQPGMMVVTRGNESLYPGAKIIPVSPGGGMPGMGGAGGMGDAPPPEGAPEAPVESGAALTENGDDADARANQ